MRSNIRMTENLSEFLSIITKNKKPTLTEALVIFTCLVFNDMMIGDPFLTEIFRNLARNARVMLSD